MAQFVMDGIESTYYGLSNRRVLENAAKATLIKWIQLENPPVPNLSAIIRVNPWLVFLVLNIELRQFQVCRRGDLNVPW